MFLIDVTHVKALPNRKLELVFEDGLQAVVDLDRVIDSYTGVFAQLLDENYFQLVKVDIELGTIVWPNGADVCPDVLYSHASGKPITIATPPIIANAVNQSRPFQAP
jgi:hypothetical protein